MPECKLGNVSCHVYQKYNKILLITSYNSGGDELRIILMYKGGK